MKAALALGCTLASSVLMCSDAWAIKVIGRSAQPPPAVVAPAPAKKAPPAPKAKTIPTVKASAVAKPAPVAKAPKKEASAADDTLSNGQVCLLEKALKAKLYKQNKTLSAKTQVSIVALTKTEAIVLSALGDAHVKRSALAEVCGAPTQAAPGPVTPAPSAVAVAPVSAPPAVPPVSAPPAVPPVAAPAGVPPVAASAGVPPVAASAGAPPVAASSGVPPVAASSGVPPVAASAGVPPVAASSGASPAQSIPPPAVAYNVDQDREQGLRRARTRRVIAWTLMGVGAAGVATGATIFALNQSAASRLRADVVDYNAAALRTQAQSDTIADQRRSIQTLDLVTGIAGGVGLASLVTGIVLVATGDSPSRDEAKTSTSVAFTPTLGGFQLTGAF